MAALHSALYPGVVVHHRRGEFPHDLRSRVVMGLFDLDELPRLDREVAGFGVDRAAPVALRRRDHGRADGSDLRAWLAHACAEAGIDDVTGPARVLCMPRMFGYVFDPISVWFAHDRHGRLAAVVHEVRNTFGQRHAYVVPEPLAGRVGVHGAVVLRHRADKAFHVSPFFDIAGTYDFTLRLPDERVALGIVYDAGDGNGMTAAFTGRRRPFTTASLWRQVLRHPALSHKVMSAIHVQAGLLWAKGARYRPVPLPGPTTTVGHPGTATEHEPAPASSEGPR